MATADDAGLATVADAALRRPAPPAVVRWRSWVRDHPVGGALVAGFIATWIATIVGFWFAGIGLPQINWPRINGSILAPGATPTAQFVLGIFVHGITGLVFVVIFALVVFPYLGRSVSPLTTMIKCVAFSLVLATAAVGFMVPYVYFPHRGVGLFATGLGWKVPFALYLWHLAFGIALGLLYNPLPAERD